jgi:PTS system N-acetylglucosamine-specific IIA component
VAVQVTAPLSGTAVGLSEVPDPVFATAMVGPGLAIDPERVPSTVVAPVSGTIAKLKPHALVIVADGGRGVLVHLGIDTVHLDGEGFRLLAAEGDSVVAGQPIVEWNPADVEARGLSPVCPVVALDALDGSVAELAHGPIGLGAPLFVWN